MSLAEPVMPETVPSSLPYKGYYFSVFAGPAIISTYLNLYFKRSGLSDAWIGELSAILSIVGILSPPLWGAISDRLGSNTRPGMALMAITGLLVPCFLWVKALPWVILLVLLLGVTISPIVPLADASTMAYIRRWGGDYGRIRVWGSIGFMVVIAVTGALLRDRSQVSAAALAPAFLALPAWRLIGLWWASRIPEEPRSKPGEGEAGGLWGAVAAAASLFRRGPLLLLTVCSFLGWGAMQAYYAFFSIYLDALHVPDIEKGWFWNIGVLAEILFLTQSGRLQTRLGNPGLFALGLAAQAARLLLFSFHAPLWAIGLGQALHAFTFASFYVACIGFLGQHVPDRLRAGGQAFFSAAVMGLGAAVGAWAAGAAAHAHGLEWMFRASSSVAATALVIFILFRRGAGAGSGSSRRAGDPALRAH